MRYITIALFCFALALYVHDASAGDLNHDTSIDVWTFTETVTGGNTSSPVNLSEVYRDAETVKISVCTKPGASGDSTIELTLGTTAEVVNDNAEWFVVDGMNAVSSKTCKSISGPVRALRNTAGTSDAEWWLFIEG